MGTQKQEEYKRINEMLTKLRGDPCEWCNDTSQRIDSLEYELEAKDKLIAKFEAALFHIQKQCLLDGHITK